VYAFSGNVCASGGYLIAAAARELIVQPAAVVGSIGVISIRPLAEEFLHRYGLAVGVTKSGELKDSGAFWRKPTAREREKEQALVDEYFALFLERIEAGRKIDPARLRELATGEIFTGRRAVEVGLADRVGTLEDTIELAAGAAGEVTGGVSAYFVGFFGGRPVLNRYGKIVLLGEEELERGEADDVTR